jgi:hypothetical protein
MGLRIKSISELPALLRSGYVDGYEGPVTKPRKYRNVPVEIDGERFDSKLEARCFQWLVLRWKAGEILWFTRQVSFVLEGGVKVRLDFIAPLTRGGVEVIDAKGVLTQSSANKYKQLKARYGIDVILWKGK